MSNAPPWGWLALVLLGAYHGINPGMGWLFAVGLGIQENSARAVVRSLVPIAMGHAAAIGAVVLVARLVEIILPLVYVKITAAGVLVALGLYKIVRSRHFGWGGMQVGFRDLTIWSFLVASAHGAGLMVLPVVLSLSVANHMHAHDREPMTGAWATLLHTAAYLAVTAAIALVVYQRLGLSLLRRAWFNLDRMWAIALMATGCLALIL